jgi:endonuclease YncB( thermonuclease family)
VIRFLSIFSILAAFFLGNMALANVIHGRVVGVSDGDSVTVIDANKTQYKIRLAGIDAPERAQAYGQKSKQSLSDLVFGKQVDVEWSKRDRYGRTVGKLMLGGVDINLEQIKIGMAWHYKEYQNEQSPEDRVAYAQSESQAQDKKMGLWRDPAPVQPAVCCRRPKTDHLGVQLNSWTGLCCKSQALKWTPKSGQT